MHMYVHTYVLNMHGKYMEASMKKTHTVNQGSLWKWDLEPRRIDLDF